MQSTFVRRHPRQVALLLVACSLLVTATLVLSAERGGASEPSAATLTLACDAALRLQTVEARDAEAARSAIASSDPRARPLAHTPAERSGTARILSFTSREPLANSSWNLRRAGTDPSSDGSVLPRTTAADGTLSIPEGVWMLEDSAGMFAAMTPTLHVAAGDDFVVFAQRMGRLSFALMDTAGAPLGDVETYWIPRRTLELRANDPTRVEPNWLLATSNGAGLVEFESCPYEAGTALFLAPGFAREERRISGGMTGCLTVRMTRSSATDVRIALHSAIDGAPVLGARVQRADGVPVAEARATSNELEIPQWVLGDEQLTLTAPAHCESTLRTREIVGGRLDVFPACSVAVVVQAAGEAAGNVLVHCEFVDRAQTSPSARPNLPADTSALLGSPTNLVVPRGCSLRFVALDDRGRSASAVRTFSTEAAQLELSLDDSRGFDIHVSDAAGPVAAAWALVSGSNGTKVRIPSDATGTIRIPGDVGTSWIEVGALDHATVGLRRPSRVRTEREGEQDLFVVLQPCVDVPIRLVAASGEPVRGARVWIWRHAVDDVDPGVSSVLAAHGSEWKVQNPKAIIGITDTHGEFVAKRVRRGLVDVQVNLGPQFSVNGNGSSLFDLRRESIEIIDASPVSIVCDTPRHVALNVIEATTGLPISHFEIRDEEGKHAEQVEGSFWQGWVRAEAQRLVVTAPSVGSTVLSATDLPTDGALEVRITPDQPCELTIEGLPSGSVIGTLNVLVWHSANAAGGLLAQVSIDAQADRATLALPFSEEVKFGIEDFELAGRRWTLEPAAQPFVRGRTARFVAKPVH